MGKWKSLSRILAGIIRVRESGDVYLRKLVIVSVCGKLKSFRLGLGLGLVGCFSDGLCIFCVCFFFRGWFLAIFPGSYRGSP